MLSPVSAAVTLREKIGQGLTEAVETSPAYTNNIDMNPVSQEIADTNFLETKIYSSKYINAKT